MIIRPDDNMTAMTGEASGDDDPPGAEYPPEYRSGLGTEGVAALEAFVENGGTLVTFARAGALPIERFDLPVRNIVAGVPTAEFWSPGSTLRIDVETDDPLGYGMPSKALAMFLQGNHVYEVVPSDRNHRVRRVARFVDRDVLQSGWLLGGDLIADHAAIVAVGHGDGEVVLIGFRTQHRAQTHGTFKFVFNALLGATSTPEEVAASGRQ